MKKLLVIIAVLFSGFLAKSQDLPKDVEKVYKGAEKLKSRKDYQDAVAAYKEVLRSVNHVPSMVSIAEIEMDLKPSPNYTIAYDYLDKAIRELELQISAAKKNKEKAFLGKEIQRLTPKRNKAKSHVDDYNKLRENKQDGKRLLEDEDLD
jgi:predicted  nucleic acid-binding Zn-ribbon protein